MNCTARAGGAEEQEGEGRLCEEAERDEEDYINQDGERD